MAKKPVHPFRETDQEAIALAQKLMDEADTAALGVIEPGTGMPLVSRVAVMLDEDGSPLMLASQLSMHTKAILEDNRASLLLGEPGEKGAPLTHPRITVIGCMKQLNRNEPGHATRRENWLKRHPKAKLYVDFADFQFYRMDVERANLNGGFGKAYQLTVEDLKTG